MELKGGLKRKVKAMVIIVSAISINTISDVSPDKGLLQILRVIARVTLTTMLPAPSTFFLLQWFALGVIREFFGS